MKNIIRNFSLVMMLASGLCFSSQTAHAQISVSFQVFYDELSPYGNWVDNADYGYVWVPDVSPGFTPYATNGHWIFTDEGWTWVSNYSWGWAPFHYGRWYIDPYYGPVWIPGNEWGPGWVTWRRSDSYYGWAPIGPGNYNFPYNQWTFVRNRDFGRPNIYNYYINNSSNITIINNTTVINNTRIDRARNVTYNAGPERTEVEKHRGIKISPVQIKESDKPVQKLNNNQLQLYRPKLQNAGPGETKPAPVKLTRKEDIKPIKEREIQQPKQQPMQPVKRQQPDQPQKERPVIREERKQPDKQAQPSQKQPVQQQKERPVRQDVPRQQPQKQQEQQQRNIQPSREQPAQQQKERPVRQDVPRQQPQNQQEQQQRNVQPEKQMQNNRPAKQQPAPRQQQNNQPDRSSSKGNKPEQNKK